MMNNLESQARAMMAENDQTEPVQPASGQESEQTTIKRLAALSPIDYDRARKLEAEKLGISVGTLDRAVKQASQNEIDDSGFPNVEPWPHPVNPAQLLDEISKIIRRFIVLDKFQADIAALWVAACWFIDQINVAPIALINAPERACGKSQLLTVLSKLAPRAAQLSGISPSVLFRMIERYQPTLFVDEIETVLADNEDLRGLFNAGHTRDSAFIWRSVAVGDDFEPKRFSVWGMKAIAGINAVKLAETVTSRAIVFELRRKKPDECVDRLRYADPGLFEVLAAKLARFAMDYAEEVRRARPSLPDELGDREQDNIEPLLQIATVAGGHWPDTATKAALRIFKSSKSNQSTANELLADIQEIFEVKCADKISTADLIGYLIEDIEKSWATYNRGRPLSPKQLANKLRDYGIYSKSIWLGYGNTPKGYEQRQFVDAFDRYLASTPQNLPPCRHESPEASNHADLHIADRKNMADDKKQNAMPKPAPILGHGGMADKTPLPKEERVRI